MSKQMEASLTRTGEQMLWCAGEIIKWERWRPECNQKAVELAITAARLILKEFDNDTDTRTDVGTQRAA